MIELWEGGFCMSGRIPLYGAIAGLIIFVLAMIGIYGGVKVLFYSLLVPAIFILVVYFSFKLLPHLWASILVAGLSVLAVYIFFGSWSLTIILFCYLFFLIFVDYVIKNKKWSSVVMNVTSILFIVILFFLVLKRNIL